MTSKIETPKQELKQFEDIRSKPELMLHRWEWVFWMTPTGSIGEFRPCREVIIK